MVEEGLIVYSCIKAWVRVAALGCFSDVVRLLLPGRHGGDTEWKPAVVVDGGLGWC